MTAQEILAQGLGYRDFHDVSMSSKNCEPDAPVPTLPEVRDSISTSIFHFLKSTNAVGFVESDIQRLLMLLPLHELLTFNSFRQWQTANVGKADSHSSAARPGQKSPETAQGLIHKASDSSGSVFPNSASPVPSRNYLNVLELNAIAKVVRDKGILRDRFLFSVLLCGIRQAELLQLKVEHINYSHQGVLLYVSSTRSHASQHWRFLATTNELLVATYVKESGVTYGDYLFPSSKATGHPMTPIELNKILRSWLLEAQIDPTGVSIHTMRHSVIASLIRASAEPTQSKMAHMLGHYSLGISRQYISTLNRKPKA